MKRWLLLSAGVGTLLLGFLYWQQVHAPWRDGELALIRSLQLDNFESLMAEPLFAAEDQPTARTMGRNIFFDKRFSANGQISCATCHQPQLRFTDGKARSQALGTSKRNAPSLIGAAASPWYYWDGRKDSLWSQALSPLEDPAEHGSNRLHYARLLASDQNYRSQYLDLFGPLPDFDDQTRFPLVSDAVNQPAWHSAWSKVSNTDQRLVNTVFSNLGKVVAAYERMLLPGPSRFDHYVATLDHGESTSGSAELSPLERLGLRIFIGKGNCTQCHNGPLLTNNSFHNIGNLPSPGTTPDLGRRSALQTLLTDSFNCTGPFSQAESCDELTFMQTGKETIGAMRTPSLRNLGGTAPYGHAGQHASLLSVVNHYDEAPEALIGHNEAKPLNLWFWEHRALTAFLQTLDAPPAIDSKWLSAPTE